jgi:hypothetical protein
MSSPIRQDKAWHATRTARAAAARAGERSRMCTARPMGKRRAPPAVKAEEEAVREGAAAVDVVAEDAVAALELPGIPRAQQHRRRAARGRPQRIVCVYAAADQHRLRPACVHTGQGRLRQRQTANSPHAGAVRCCRCRCHRRALWCCLAGGQFIRRLSAESARQAQEMRLTVGWAQRIQPTPDNAVLHHECQAAWVRCNDICRHDDPV